MSLGAPAGIVAVLVCSLFVGCTAADDGARRETAPPTARPTESPSPGTTSDATWATCRNEPHDYSVGYPEEWHTDRIRERDACRWFDPSRFSLEPQTEAPLTALMVGPTRQPYEDAVDSLGERHRIELREEVEVAGRSAVRYELVQTEDLLWPQGTRTYGYLINHDGSAFYVRTVSLPGVASDFERNKRVVDGAVERLELGPAA